MNNPFNVVYMEVLKLCYKYMLVAYSVRISFNLDLDWFAAYSKYALSFQDLLNILKNTGEIPEKEPFFLSKQFYKKVLFRSYWASTFVFLL